MKLQIVLPLVVLTAVFSFLILTAGCGDWGTGGGGGNPFLQIPDCPPLGSLHATTSTVAGVYGVDLTWAASTGVVTAYTVYYATPPTTSDVPADYTSVSVGNLLSYTVSGLGTAGAVYTFRVTASNTSGECTFANAPSADEAASILKPSWEEIK